MTVQLTINDQKIDTPAGRTLFDYAEQAGVRVPTSCQKNGKCRECMVEVIEGYQLLSPRTREEEHLPADFRLACRASVAAQSGSIRCHTMRRGKMVIADKGNCLEEVLADAPLDPAITRDGRQVLLDGRPIAESTGPLYGLALDLGTTTVVVRLVDLETGLTLQSQSFENPQRFGGSDVMARISYDTHHPGRLLQRTLLGYLGHAIEAFNCMGTDIYEMVVAGNTTMRDLCFGLNVHSIGQRPYQSLTEKAWLAGSRTTTALTTVARRLRLPIHPAARIYGMPLVRGHVGADAAACMLAIDLAREDRLIALMDIGTNTELVVGNRQRLLAASCPAGPAFEGGAIAWGMPGLPGAIEKVSIDQDGRVICQVIGGGPAQGICGSGLVDTLSELLRTGRMDHFGRLAEGADRFVLDQQAGLFVCEEDLSQLAQAKGANVAGLRIVLDTMGTDFAHLDRFYLAGGFARHLDLAAAKRIGLIPDIPSDRILQIGNAAIEGATLALRSVSRRRELERLVRDVTHVELETNERFFDHYVEGCLYLPVTSANSFTDS
jgi:uncharacterized 2Fe-2S/4Fe-4S cluster protein (DUF4445 family)